MEVYGLPRDVDPQQALLEEVYRTAGHVAWLMQRVAEIPQDQLTRGAQVNVWVRLYQDERDRLARVAKAAIDAGVARRAVALAEDQARQLASIISAILTDLGHSLDDDRVRKIARLRLSEGGTAYDNPGRGGQAPG